MGELITYESSVIAARNVRSRLAQITDPRISAVMVHAAKETKDLARKISRAARNEGESWNTAFEWEHTWIEAMRHAGGLISEGQERGEIATQGNQPNAKPNELLDLGISHIQSSRWQRLASIHPEDFRIWVEERKERGVQLTMSGALALLRFEEDWEPLPEGKFGVIYADPPWDFQNTFQVRQGSQAADAHYSTLPTTKICELPLSDALADETVLYLWVPNALMMQDGRVVIDAWGFKYKTCMVWLKPSGPSMGWWIQNRHEMLLIGTRKKTPLPRIRHSSVFEGSVSEHSRKPKCVYAMIEEAFDGPYLELFAREKRDGWKAWGNEI